MPLQTFDDIPRPPIPEQEFNTSYFKAEEVNTFVKKARAKSAPDMNGISYKLYKNCPDVRNRLYRLLLIIIIIKFIYIALIHKNICSKHFTCFTKHNIVIYMDKT